MTISWWTASRDSAFYEAMKGPYMKKKTQKENNVLNDGHSWSIISAHQLCGVMFPCWRPHLARGCFPILEIMIGFVLVCDTIEALWEIEGGFQRFDALNPKESPISILRKKLSRTPRKWTSYYSRESKSYFNHFKTCHFLQIYSTFSKIIIPIS